MMPQLIYPDWPLRNKVTAFTTTRVSGASTVPYDELNLALHVGDNRQDVLNNRIQVNKILGNSVDIKWLKQTHSVTVVNAATIDADAVEADASFTTSKDIACAALTADCLPLLFSDQDGKCIGAAHAGWRGLVDGVIENTIATMSDYIKPTHVWLGPAIGPGAFEVGEDVYEAYMKRNVIFESCFEFINTGKWNLDIYQAAKIVLEAADIPNIYGGSYCTYNETDRFYSYRRNSVTGRMATIIARC